MKKIRREKKQVKKVITFNPSSKDFTLDIAIKLRPEKYKPIEEIVSNATCFTLVCFIIGGNYKLIICDMKAALKMYSNIYNTLMY